MTKPKSSIGALKLMQRVYKYVLPEVDKHLKNLEQRALKIPNIELRTQALASMKDKKFHCQGGGVYAIVNLEARDSLLALIVALQTISDYLDNLCDRSTSLDEEDFRLLHQSMLDAVNPDAKLQDYYAYREDCDDAGYLHHLVNTCQQMVRSLPSYSKVQSEVTELVGLYCDLQVYKHIEKPLREEKLQTWWNLHKARYPQLYWNEFAAATGSTLGMFMLFMAASEESLTSKQAKEMKDLYFPHVCGLHIMLDYLIDQQEDRLGGDLNFCHYYNSNQQMIERIQWIVNEARADVKKLPEANVHRLIIEGLLALYLSDPKVKEQTDVSFISKQLMKNSPLARTFFWVNSLWIRKKKI